MSYNSAYFRNRGLPCAKRRCGSKRFMDSQYCFRHDTPGPSGATLFSAAAAWLFFIVAVNLAVLAGVAWAVYELVTWVTSS